MKRRFAARGREVRLAMAVSVSLAASPVLAGVSYTSGTVLFTHDPDLGSGTPPNAGTILTSVPASASMPASPNFQFSRTAYDLSSSSTAKGSIGVVTSATTATFALAGGTGIAQSDPGDNFVLGSSLRIDLNNLVYTVTSPGFGPTAVGYFSVTTAGVVGAGGSANFSASVSFVDHDTGTPLRSPVSFNTTFSTAGSFSQTFLSSLPFSPTSLAPGKKIRLSGFIEFRAINDVTPTLLEPTVVDIGGAPPTSRFVGTGAGTLLWNNAANWESDIIPGGVPNAVGDRALFAPSTDAAANTTVQLTTPITLGTLAVADVFGGNVTIGGSGTLNLDVTSGSAVMEQRNARGGGSVNVAANVALADPLDVIVESPNSLTISGNISGIGSTPITKLGPGRLTLSGNNTFQGGVIVREGTVSLASPAAIGGGTGALELSAGGNVVFSSTGSATFASPIILDAGTGTPPSLTTNGTLTFLGSINGTSAQFNVNAARARIEAFAGLGTLLVGKGTLEISGNGVLPNLLRCTNDGSIVLNNGTISLPNRIADNASIVSRGASLAITGPVGANVTETIGQYTLAGGLNFITLTAGAAGQTQLQILALGRQDGGVGFVRGTNLGAAPGANVTNVLLVVPPPLFGAGGPPGTPQVSVVPFLFGATSPTAATTATTNSLVTYDPATGLRPLNLTTEYQNTLPPVPQPVNVRLVNSATLSAPTMINSLVLGPGGNILGGGQTLTIQSGAVLNSNSGATLQCELDFGPQEGVLIASQPFTVSGGLHGTGGVTKAGLNNATFTGISTYTGKTRVTGGALIFSGDVMPGAIGPLGLDTSPVVLAAPNGFVARLYASAPGTTVFSRDLLVTGSPNGTNGFGNLGSGGQTVVVNGNITLNNRLVLEGDPGALLVFNGVISGPGALTDDFRSIHVLNAANTYTGGTIIRDGIYRLGHNQALGTSTVTFASTSTLATGAIEAVASTFGLAPIVIDNPIVLQADPTFSGSEQITINGPITLGGVRTHNITNTADTEYAGGMTGGGLIKAGAGRLIISGYSNYNGVTTISAGEVMVRGVKPLGSPVAPTIVNSGATLRLDFDARMVEPVTVSGTGNDGLGALKSTGEFTSTGTLTLTGSTLINTAAGSRFDVLHLNDYSATLTTSGAGTFTVNRFRGGALALNAGVAQIRPDGTNDATSRIVALSVAPGAALDITNNAMVIDYGGPSPLATVTALIASGYAGGAWTGLGIRSSTAAATTGVGVGIAEASAIGSPPTFYGQPADATSLLLRYTLYGDANLDRTVNIADFSLLAAGFNLPGGWVNGDFNYSGVVNLADFSLLASNFNQVLPAPALPRPAGDAAVPEPALLPLLPMVWWGTRRRR